YHIITLTDTAGVENIVKTYYKPNDMLRFDMEGILYTYDLDRLFALINEDRDFVLIQYFVFDKVFRELEYFRVK
ncbi:MAG: hypothetical protein K8R53_00620, partial [Bacteroidales bacterium]|nr:hypothetical protein [Bacteroidales bacterium]